MPALQRWLDPGPRRRPLPAGREFAGDRQHWLLTDGSSPDVADWASAMPLDRVLRVGEETENAAITRLAVRPMLGDPQQLRGMVQLLNAGSHPSARSLEIWREERRVLHETVELAPGETRTRSFATEASQAGELRARLAPDDALPEDDQHVLDPRWAAGLPAWLDPACGTRLSRAIRSHPGLRLVDEETAELRIGCAAEPDRSDTPTLWFPATLDQEPRRSFQPAAAGGEPPPDGWPAGNARSVVAQLDLDDPDHVAGPVDLAKLSALLDRAAQRRLLERSAEFSLPGGPAAARVAPGTVPNPATATARMGVATRTDLAPILLGLAGLLLLADGWWTRRGR